MKTEESLYLVHVLSIIILNYSGNKANACQLVSGMEYLINPPFI